MYDEIGADGKRWHTVAEIAAEFGVTRPAAYWYLECPVGHGAKESADHNN